MKRIVLIGLAAAFALAAILVAMVGLRSGDGKASKAAPHPYPVVVAATELPPGHVLRMVDLRTREQPTLPPNAFSSPEALVGRQLLSQVGADQPLLGGMLAERHPLAAQLLPGERAVALKTDKIVGVGGYLLPGDWVDVLVYVRGQNETAGRSSALLALSRLRVLSYENQILDSAAAQKPAEPANAAPASRVSSSDRSERNPTVVLAVPEDQAARLLLAAESGSVRLALRPPESTTTALNDAPMHNPPPVNAREARQLSLSQMSFSKPVATPGAMTAAAPANKPAAARAHAAPQVEIYDGDKLRTSRQP